MRWLGALKKKKKKKELAAVLVQDSDIHVLSPNLQNV